ncbi:hypothetical protein IGI37_001140 [Enterococcus sp. AZ194]|uniref:GNAT family N-acetyltransferase n=1 Tax=Enterococcus sp. AZ194 TaxID=2774629 RepID=UPI003F2329A9
MIQIRYAKMTDASFWFSLDKHLSKAEFEKKVRDKMAYLLIEDDRPIGILRYNFFWDNLPFCTLLYVDEKQQQNGYGTKLMAFWEIEMKELGYGMVMTSTQVDEQAQYFYRKLGFNDAGSLMIDVPKYKQPLELFLIKEI